MLRACIQREKKKRTNCGSSSDGTSQAFFPVCHERPRVLFYAEWGLHHCFTGFCAGSTENGLAVLLAPRVVLLQYKLKIDAKDNIWKFSTLNLNIFVLLLPYFHAHTKAHVSKKCVGLAYTRVTYN